LSVRAPRDGLLGRVAAVSVLAALGSGCSHLSGGYTRCDAVPRERLAQLPSRLSETGLYQDRSVGHLAATVRGYRPRFELFSDGAVKRRWVELPGLPIDTRDMDDWRFPSGTKFWKEFSYDGKPVETRLLEKVGPESDAWVAAAYVWLPDGSDALLSPEGRDNVAGTPHRVPAASECFACHGGTQSRVLGFSAIQLSGFDERESELSLQTLRREGSLSDPPLRDPSIPGDAGSAEALGYLHANCGHCHNLHRPLRSGARCFDPQRQFDLSLRTDELGMLTEVAAYRSTLDGILVPGDPEHSELYRRMDSGSMFLRRMPPLATQSRDDAALARLLHWISELPCR
jgi:cytochrome c553